MNALELGLLLSRIQAVCDEMGATLRRTAFSPNIKDRLDFSCAVFSTRGELCAQAAHIPVHLGSMAYAMRDIVAGSDWDEGDMVIVNDPYLGGTHLPDVTLIAPVFVAGRRVAFVANRAHHADIGCARPGSMPLSRTLAEEGMVIAPAKLLVRGGMNPVMLETLERGLRNPRATLGDFSAQISANRVGVERLAAVCAALGTSAFAAALAGVNDYAETLSRKALAQIPAGVYRHTDYMDGDGFDAAAVPISVSVRVDQGTIEVDFTGTSAEVTGNINCPLSVTAAAVFYVFYCLMPTGTPACAGSARPIRITAPAGSLVNARRPAAVAAGNVETSQRIVDALLGALAAALPERIPAAACGSMNNLALGGAGWDYYETIGGGTGGHAGGRGLDAVHTHMTNTLNTPIEVLESNFPLRIRAYGVRGDSGGAGRHRGGDGMIREFEFLAPASITLLTERRSFAPWGAAGGGPGARGLNVLNGRTLPPKAEVEVETGDRLRLMTPGGGGWGSADYP
ncbi:MAG: hydantoinase B/oxoprolinase family protein [Gammaproteobacteria bacterium]|nr:hydantoinase B/oxoprolinase family protein [Gammaproteobacteria bacterium]MBI5617352.1 hydantoinase B/oxoprolinase family protein [Gammaproteobacteria bacterium]